LIFLEFLSGGGSTVTYTPSGTTNSTRSLDTDGEYEWRNDRVLPSGPYAGGLARNWGDSDYFSNGQLTHGVTRSGSVSATFDDEGNPVSASGSLQLAHTFSGNAVSFISAKGKSVLGSESGTGGMVVATRNYTQGRNGSFNGGETTTMTPQINSEGHIVFDTSSTGLTGTRSGSQTTSDIRSVYEIYNGTVQTDGNMYSVTDSGDAPSGGSSINYLLPSTDFADDPPPEQDASLSSGGLGYFASAFGFRGGIVGASFATALPGDPTIPGSTNFGDVDFGGNYLLQEPSSDDPPGTTYILDQLDGDMVLGVRATDKKYETKTIDWGLPIRYLPGHVADYAILMGMLQGLVNIPQGLQDGFVSTVNTPAFAINNIIYWTDWSGNADENPYYVPYFESYQWANGLFGETDETTYEISKASGSFGISLLTAPPSLFSKGGKYVSKFFSWMSGANKVTSKTDDVVNQLRKMCFARDTLVSTETGLRPIGELNIGDRVYSFDFSQGCWALREITDRIDSLYTGSVLTIETDDSQIEVTIHHPFWVVRGHELGLRSVPRGLKKGENEGQSLTGRWVNSHELMAGDVIIGQDGQERTIVSINQRYEESFPVSNLTIGEFHNYAVGAGSILVHNEAICAEGEAWLKQLITSGQHSADEVADFVKHFKFTNGDEVLKRIAPISGLPIQFGKDANQVYHAFRHIEGIVDKSKAIAAITDDLNAAAGSLQAGLIIRKVIVDGVELTYNAFKLPDGIINVGRITIPKL
jgi:hypothetical protein